MKVSSLQYLATLKKFNGAVSFIRCDPVLAAPSWSVHSQNYLKVIAKLSTFQCLNNLELCFTLFLSKSSEKVIFPKYQTCTVDLVVTHDIFLVQINLSF